MRSRLFFHLLIVVALGLLGAPGRIWANQAMNVSVAHAVQVPPANVATVGELQVKLVAANGKLFGMRTPGSVPGWRFAGDTTWHSSGDIIQGLTPGTFPIEFESIVNFSGATPSILPAPREARAVVTVGPTSVRTFRYPPFASTGTGSVQVVILPYSVAQASALQQRGQWRFFGETMWRNGAATVAGLPEGSYVIELKTTPSNEPVTPFNTPVTPNHTSILNVTYGPIPSVTGALPSTVTYAQATTQQPYEFVGQLTAEASNGVFFGSGTVVSERIVLTAAHVIFDDATLSFVKGVQWSFEEFTLQSEPEPLVPRGAFILDGYAAARMAATTSAATPASQSADAAALFFDAPAGNGGSSGYLVSNGAAGGTDWLPSAQSKVLVGYPVDIGQSGDAVIPGQMQATAATATAMTAVNGETQVYSSTQFAGLSGMSGGPLCVEGTDGLYYPAGIYLGGNNESDVRAIDPAVNGIIEHAELLSGGGANHVGGGTVVVQSEVMGSGGLSVAMLTVNFTGGPTGAGWKLPSETSFHAGGATVPVSSNQSLTLTFSPVSGYVTPPNYAVTLKTGESLTLNVPYNLPPIPVIATTALPLAGTGLAYDATINAANAPTSYLATLTDPSGNAVTGGVSALGLTLSSAGKLSGTIPSGATTGIYRLAVTAKNATGSGSATFDLMVSPTATLSVNFDAAMGSVTLGSTKLTPNQTLPALPEGTTVTLTATPKSSSTLFSGWTGTGTASVPISTPTLQFNLGANVQLTAQFVANPFPAVAGVYNGLLTGGADALSARGYFTANVAATGSATLSFYAGAQHFAAKAAFVSDGSLSYVVVGPGTVGTATLALQLDVAGGTKTLTGSVTYNGVTLTLSANEAVYSTKTPAPQALGKTSARYTMALPHPTGAGLPQGDGYGTVLVTAAGGVTFVGTLGDGTPVSAGTSLGLTGEWPLFALIYSNAGVVTGALSIPVQPTAPTSPVTPAISGSLDWLKPASKSTYYPAGFTITSGQGKAIQAQGEPLGNAPLTGLTQATLSIAGGGLNPVVGPYTVNFTSKGVGSVTGVTGFSLTITPTTGRFSGKFLDASKISRSFGGVLLPAYGSASAAGFGAFEGGASSQATGSVEF